MHHAEKHISIRSSEFYSKYEHTGLAQTPWLGSRAVAAPRCGLPRGLVRGLRTLRLQEGRRSCTASTGSRGCVRRKAVGTRCCTSPNRRDFRVCGTCDGRWASCIRPPCLAPSRRRLRPVCRRLAPEGGGAQQGSCGIRRAPGGAQCMHGRV